LDFGVNVDHVMLGSGLVLGRVMVTEPSDTLISLDLWVRVSAREGCGYGAE